MTPCSSSALGGRQKESGLKKEESPGGKKEVVVLRKMPLCEKRKLAEHQPKGTWWTRS